MKNTKQSPRSAGAKALFSALLTLALLTLACGERPATSAADTGTEAVQWVQSGATLLDVRTPAEFARGHVRGAINIPVQELVHRIDEVPAGRVVVYCQSGGRSASATRTLRGTRREVLDLGGIANWPRPEDVAP